MKPITYTRAQALPGILASRIAILDGAMGTMIQRFKLGEAQYRGEGYTGPGNQGDRFKDFPKDVKGNNELLSLTRPDVITDIHEAYLAAGADMIETNTFGATTVAQADYDMADLAIEMNYVSATLAQKALTVWPLRMRPEASVTVPLMITGRRSPLFSKNSSIANSAALALSVSKMVSTRNRSQPPSSSPLACAW